MKTAATKVGPKVGTPPTLEWLAPNRLDVDLQYQRMTDGPQSRRVIAGMLKTWDWRLCQPLIVARRENGALFVIDGQHRLEGAIRRADIDHLPCVVIPSAAVAEEAHTFVALNNKRQKLSQGQVFAASLAAQDPDAHRALTLIEGAGLSLARSHDPSNWEPGQIFCGPAIMKALRQHGDGVVSNALVAIAEAFEGQVLSRAASLLLPLYMIYADDAKRPGFDPDLFIESLGSIEQQAWLELGQDVRRARRDVSHREATAIAMMEAYDGMRQQDAE